MPSLAALLGLLAVAGYQNRDKLQEMLNNMSKDPGAAGAGPLGGIMKTVTDFVGADTVKSVQGGIAEVVGRFRDAGHGAAADTWVSTGPNQPVTPQQTETALGPDIVDALVKQTGLTREDLLARLAKVLPEAVDTMTPGGSLPKA